MLIAALLALLPLAAASVSFTSNVPPNLAIGDSVTLKWTTDAKPVKVTLISGTAASNNIYSLIDVVCNSWITNVLANACTSSDDDVKWTPDKTVPEGRYSFMIVASDGSVAYSNFITISKSGGGGPGGAGATTSAAGPAATSSSSGAGAAPATSTGAGAGQAGASQDDGSGLSTAGKAGVGAGAAVGGVALLGGIGFLVFRMGKKAAGNKKKDNGSGGEEGDAALAAAAAIAAAKEKEDGEKKNHGPAEMPAPDTVHEAPDYKQHLKSARGPEFFSELDATGGSFVLSPSRPTSAAGMASAEVPSNESTLNNSSPSEVSPMTPQIMVTSPEASTSNNTAGSESPPKDSQTKAAKAEAGGSSGAPAAAAAEASQPKGGEKK